MADLSPLSQEQQSLAVELLRRHETGASYMSGRSRAVLVAPALEGTVKDDAQHVVVGVYDYSQDRSLAATIDLRRQAVVSVEEVPVQFQLSAEERTEAESLAAADARVVEFLAGRPMNPLTRLYFPPSSARHAPPHRYAIVFLRPTKDDRRYAVVDLSERQVAELLSPEHLTAQ